MGCGSSSWSKVNSDQLKGQLTERQIQIVKDTWDLISDDLEGTGKLIFKRFLQTERDLHGLFRGLSKKNEDGIIEDVEFDDNLVTKHASVVMETLGAAVECLEDTVFLTRVLVALGEIHGVYGVKPQHLACMWLAIRHGLVVVLQDVFTEEVEQTWKIVFNYIISKMREGIKSGRKKNGSNSLLEGSSAAISQTQDGI